MNQMEIINHDILQMYREAGLELDPDRIGKKKKRNKHKNRNNTPVKQTKNLFISQPMSGLTNEEIMNVRQKATKFISDKYPDYTISVLPSYKEQPDNTYNATSAVNLLGNAISLMARANVIYFVPGWQKSRGCQIENEIARRWLEETGVELIEDGMEKVNVELTTEQLDTLKSEADKAGMSVQKFINLKLQQAMTDGTLEKIAEEIKSGDTEVPRYPKEPWPGYTMEETKACIDGERQIAEEHLKMLEAKEKCS